VLVTKKHLIHMTIALGRRKKLGGNKCKWPTFPFVTPLGTQDDRHFVVHHHGLFNPISEAKSSWILGVDTATRVAKIWHQLRMEENADRIKIFCMRILNDFGALQKANPFCKTESFADVLRRRIDFDNKLILLIKGKTFIYVLKWASLWHP
jgi:hypothetical protein